MDWFPHYIDDFDADTIHLSAEEDGAYCRLLRWYYKNERPLPDNDNALAAICRISLEAWQAISATLRPLFVTRDTTKSTTRVLHHKRCDKVLLTQNKRRKDWKERQEKLRNNNIVDNVTRDSSECLRPIGEERIKKDSPPLVPPPGEKQKRGSAMADNWKPSEANTEHCLLKGYALGQITPIADHFRDHHTAKGTISKSWDASWRTWITNDLKFHGDPRHRSSPRTGSGRGDFVDVVTRLKAEAEREELLSGGWGVPAGGDELHDAGDDPAAAADGLAGREGVIDSAEAERLFRVAGAGQGAHAQPRGVPGGDGGTDQNVRPASAGVSSGRGAVRVDAVAEKESVVASVGRDVPGPGTIVRAASPHAQSADDGLEIPLFLRRTK